MIKLFSVSRSPATAAAGSAVLIVTALVGVVLAAGSAAGPSTASSQSASAPFNAGPLVLPEPCAAAKGHQACGVAATKQGHAKHVKKHRVQPSLLPAPTAVPSAIPTTSP